MQAKYGEFVNVDNVHFALITKDDETDYTAETPAYLAPTAEITGEPQIENTPTYYDGVPGFNYVSEGATELTITFSGVPAKLMAKLLGKDYDEDTGRVLDSGVPNPPDVALSFRFQKGSDSYRYYQYLKGNFSGGAEAAATRTDTYDVRTYQMIYTAIVTSHQWNIGNSKKGLKRIFADTDDASFEGAGAWFNSVQTPDGEGED